MFRQTKPRTRPAHWVPDDIPEMSHTFHTSMEMLVVAGLAKPLNENLENSEQAPCCANCPTSSTLTLIRLVNAFC